jgi:hypothetical protein
MDVRFTRPDAPFPVSGGLGDLSLPPTSAALKAALYALSYNHLLRARCEPDASLYHDGGGLH